MSIRRGVSNYLTIFVLPSWEPFYVSTMILIKHQSIYVCPRVVYFRDKVPLSEAMPTKQLIKCVIVVASLAVDDGYIKHAKVKEVEGSSEQ